MKTAEEFLKNSTIGTVVNSILKSQLTTHRLNQFYQELEQFRKEGMEEAWDKGYESGSDYIRNRHWKSPETFITFKEWYNNQI